jgi:hypothetical protein
MSPHAAKVTYARMALAPGVLGAIVLLAGLALVRNSWYIGVLYVTANLA